MVVVCVQSDAVPIEFSVRSAPSFLLASDLRLLNLPAFQPGSWPVPACLESCLESTDADSGRIKPPFAHHMFPVDRRSTGRVQFLRYPPAWPLIPPPAPAMSRVAFLATQAPPRAGKKGRGG